MTAAHNQSQPICATPPADLLRLADWIDEARNAYLDAITRGPGGEVEKRVLANRLWDDKGTFAPALRQAAEVATLRAKVDELTVALQKIANLPLEQTETHKRKPAPSLRARRIAIAALAPSVNSQHSDGEVGR